MGRLVVREGVLNVEFAMCVYVVFNIVLMNMLGMCAVCDIPRLFQLGHEE